MNTRSKRSPAYLSTLDPKLKEVIINVAHDHNVSVEVALEIYKSAYKSVKKLMKEADDRAWPVILMAGIGNFKPNIPKRYRKYDKYHETPLKLRYKFKLLGGKPSAYHPQGIPDHLWE